jgi:hypothetical protein
VSVRGSAPSARRDAQLADAVERRLSLPAAMIDLITLVARSKAPQLKLRLAVALILTFGSKITDVLAPLLLGAAINALVGGAFKIGAAQRGAVQTARFAASGATHGVAHGHVPVKLSLMFALLAGGWALVRFLSSAAPQGRDIVFGPVGQAAQRRAAGETFAHALSLSPGLPSDQTYRRAVTHGGPGRAGGRLSPADGGVQPSPHGDGPGVRRSGPG